MHREARGDKRRRRGAKRGFCRWKRDRWKLQTSAFTQRLLRCGVLGKSVERENGRTAGVFKRRRIKSFLRGTFCDGGRKEAHGVDIRRKEWYNEGRSAKDKSRRRHFCARFKRGESIAKVKTGVWANIFAPYYYLGFETNGREANSFFALSTPISIETKSSVA